MGPAREDKYSFVLSGAAFLTMTVGEQSLGGRMELGKGDRLLDMLDPAALGASSADEYPPTVSPSESTSLTRFAPGGDCLPALGIRSLRMMGEYMVVFGLAPLWGVVGFSGLLALLSFAHAVVPFGRPFPFTPITA
jgi:hypothetical protein